MLSMSDTGPRLSEEDLRRLESKIECRLPQQYMNFLLQHNGGLPEPSWFKIQWRGQEWAEGWEADTVEYFLSIYDEPDANFLNYFETFEGRIPRDTIAIAFDPGGNLILLGTGDKNRGNVFFWMHSYETYEDEEPDYSNVGFVANSLDEFISSLFDEE